MNATKTFGLQLLAAVALAVVGTLAEAQTTPTSWVDWTSAPTGTSLSGTLSLPSGTVKAKFSGPAIYFAQVGGASDTDYWASGNPDAYAITGAPVGTDLIGFNGGTGTQLYEVSFNKPVTNPVIAILSLGRGSTPARYVFKQKPTLVSSGVGFYGGCATCLGVKGKTVTGNEGHGVIQFIGTFKTISWQQPDFESWHGVQIGAPMLPAR